MGAQHSPINLPLEQNPKIQTNRAMIQRLCLRRKIDNPQHDTRRVCQALGPVIRRIHERLVIRGRELECLVENCEVAFDGGRCAWDDAVFDDCACAGRVVASDDAAGVGEHLVLGGGHD